MSAQYYKDINNELNSIQSNLNTLGNSNNLVKHRPLHMRYSKIRGRWLNIRKNLTKTRSVSSLNHKFRRVYVNIKRRFPQLSMERYLHLSKLYKNDPDSIRHKNMNNKYSKIVTWEPYYVNNLPVDALTHNVINNKNKAIKINKSIYSLQSFRNLARESIFNVQNYHGNSILFIDPLTKKTVRRSQIEPVTIRKKNI